MRKGNFDAINETVYQFGQMGDNGGANAMAERLWQPEEPAHQCLGDQKLDRLHALPVGLEAAVGRSTSTMPRAMAGRTVRSRWLRHRL